MTYKSDIEIAQSVQPRPIEEIAASLGLTRQDIELYGDYKAKIGMDVAARLKDQPDGKLVLVTAIGKVLIHVVARMPMGRSTAET